MKKSNSINAIASLWSLRMFFSSIQCGHSEGFAMPDWRRRSEASAYSTAGSSFATLHPMASGHTMTIKSIVINLVCCFVIAPILSALILWACWALIPEPLPPPSGHSDTTQTEIIRPAPQTTVSGRTVYMAHCARCHGIDGDGRGTEKLDRPARTLISGWGIFLWQHTRSDSPGHIARHRRNPHAWVCGNTRRPRH